MRRLGYRLWGRVPTSIQRRLIYAGGHKSTLGASAVILDAHGRLLVVRHTYRRPAWGLPGGLVGRREQPEVALARELREELGVVASVGALVYADHNARYRHLTLYYTAALRGSPRLGAELDDYRFADVGELPDVLQAPTPSWLKSLLGPRSFT